MQSLRQFTLRRHDPVVHKVNILPYKLVVGSILLWKLVDDTNSVKVLCHQLALREGTCMNEAIRRRTDTDNGKLKVRYSLKLENFVGTVRGAKGSSSIVSYIPEVQYY